MSGSPETQNQQGEQRKKRVFRTAKCGSVPESLSRNLLALYDTLAGHPNEVPKAIALSSTTTDTRLLEALLLALREAGDHDSREALVRALVGEEISVTQAPQQLFRTGSPATRAMSALYKTEAPAFITPIVGGLIEDVRKGVAAASASGRPIEIDAQRMDPSQHQYIPQSIAAIEEWAQRFFDRLWGSSARFPHRVCSVLEHAKVLAEAKFPAAHGGVIAVNGLLFLRFVVPAITAPDLFGVTGMETPTPDAQRILVLISKVVQTVANNTLAGIPDNFMQPLFPLITRNFESCRAFLRSVSTVTGEPPKGTDPELPTDLDVMPKPLRDALKLILKEVECNTKAIMENLKDYPEIADELQEVAKGTAGKSLSISKQASRMLFGKASMSDDAPGSRGGSPGGCDPEEEAAKKELHKRVDEAFGKMHDRVAQEAQKRAKAEAEVARLKGVEEELRKELAHERELRAKAEKELRKATKGEEEEREKELKRALKSSRELKSSSSSGLPYMPSPSSPPMSPSVRPLSQGTSIQKPTGPLPDNIAAVIASVNELADRLPALESASHLVYVGRISRELRKLAHVGLDEDFQFAQTQAPAPRVVAIGDNEQIRGLKQLVPAVLADVKEYVASLSCALPAQADAVNKRIVVISSALFAVLTSLSELDYLPGADIPPPAAK